MLSRLLLTATTLLILSGCDLGSHKERQDNQFGGNPYIVPVNTYTGPSKEDLIKGVDTIKSEVFSSNTAIQTSQTGVNANLNKLGEKVVGLEGKIVGIEANFDQKFNASATANLSALAKVTSEVVAQFKAEFKSEIGDIKTEVQGLIKAFENVTVEARMTGEANAALKQEISKMTTEIKAGRDAYTNVYQFTKEQLEAQRSENRTQLLTILVLCASFTLGVYVVLESSRRRQVDRAKAAAEAAHLPRGVV